MKNFIQEFKAFVMRGNIVDLAVAFIIGAAFKEVITALVTFVFTPIIAAMVGEPSLAHAFVIEIGDSAIQLGAFLQQIIDFVLLAFCVFLVIKAYKKFNEEKEEEAAPSGPTKDQELLTEIRDLLKK